MSDLNITQEQLEAAMSNAGGLRMPETKNPVIEVIEQATSTGTVKNVTKVTGGELRCIVCNNGEIKPTTIVDGASTQIFDAEVGDVIVWITIVDNDRQILKQNSEGVSQTTFDKLGEIIGTKTAYALSYLSSFGGDNNILLDDEKVKRFEEANEYAIAVMGESNEGLRTLIASMCTHTDNFKDTCQTWDNATVYDATVQDDITIDWGCRVETEGEYTKFVTSYVILWARPLVMSVEGEQIPDRLLQVVTRQVNPDKVPELGRDSKATFIVNETINEQVAAYAVVTEDTLNRKLLSIELHKTKDFDVTKSSF